MGDTTAIRDVAEALCPLSLGEALGVRVLPYGPTIGDSPHPGPLAEGEGGRRSRRGAFLDVLEYCTILGFYGWLVYRIVANQLATGAGVNYIVLPSEGLVVLLVLIRRRTGDVSRRPGDWLLAFAATVAPLLVVPCPERTLVPMLYAVVGMLAGIALQVCGKLALGRSFGCVPAHRGLKTRGPYGYIRHPIYAGYLLMHVTFCLVNPNLWNLGLYVFCYLAQIPRLFAEERLLAEDAEYRQYMARVRYRLLPKIF